MVSMDDRRFAFLSREHLWHGYYLWKLEEAQAALAKNPSDTNSKFTDTPVEGETLDVQDLMSNSGQEQNVNIAEMQKLARLQKIREMFKLKQKQASQDAIQASSE
ncbi:hypothetical protein BG000_010651, partial [Podila horticola]